VTFFGYIVAELICILEGRWHKEQWEDKWKDAKSKKHSK